MRKIRAEEIQVRVAQVTSKGCSLLLYKDARFDRAILDEEFGAMCWQNDFKVIDGKMYGGIGVYDKNTSQWIWKWDCGVESNTEQEKGQASDCFKRSGFKWGIGVELYTAPFIWVNTETKQEGNRWKLANPFVKYSVKSIDYNNDAISNLEIVDDKGNTVYSMGKKVTKTTQKTESITEEKLKDQAYDKVDSIACGLKNSKTMKELLGVYNENKTQIEITPELKSIFKEVKKALIDKM